MITAEQKPIEDIREMIAPYKRILVLGCASCVAECAAGGQKETAMLASALRMKAKMNGEEKVIEEHTLDRQCVNDFVIRLADILEPYDTILSLGCGKSKPHWAADNCRPVNSKPVLIFQPEQPAD